MELYNQKKQDETNYACTIYTFCHIILFDYWIRIDDHLIIKFTYVLEKLWVFFRLSWAKFDVIYPAMVKYVNVRYWINLKIKQSTISKWLDEVSTWSLWLKRLTIKGQKLGTDDWVFTKDDVDKALTFKNAYGHNYCVKKGKAWLWIVIDSYNWVHYNCDIEVLKYWVTKWLFYDTARAIIPWDAFTERLQKSLIYKAKKFWRALNEEELKNTIKDLR